MSGEEDSVPRSAADRGQVGQVSCESTIGAEENRLRILQDMDLLDTAESEGFDRITRMASRLFQAPISAVSLTDRHRQWFKSHVGTGGREIPREGAPCAEVTRSTKPLIVPDLLDDERFAAGILAKSGVRFYAGAPLTTRDGYVLGSMCILDIQPRSVTPDEIASLGDFAAMVMSQIELQHDLGRVDALSGLPNRNQLAEDLEDLKRQDPGGCRVTVLIDLTDPRQLNQMVSVLGTVYIDDLVKAASVAIREALGRKAGLYHVGNTSFVLLLDESTGELWREVVGRISDRLKAPVISNGVPVPFDAAFGISPFSLRDSAPQDALRTSVSAAHDAREADIGYAVYSPASDEANRRRFKLLTEIREALAQPGQLSLAYQPRIDVRTQVCAGAEALLRWNHPSLGNVAPGEFIPLIEQTALVGPVTSWVIEAALRQISAWRRDNINVRVSINVSAMDLEDPEFARALERSLKQHGVPASAIEIEFTESALIRNRSRVITHLEQVRSLGVELAIDDFGTGYSTFSYLQQLPASTVKLDRSFVPGLEGSDRDQKLVRSIVMLAHDLGYRVVAEGVETAQDYAFLAQCGCDELQGYLFSRPLSPENFKNWLRDGRDRQVSSMLRLLEKTQEHPAASVTGDESHSMAFVPKLQSR